MNDPADHTRIGWWEYLWFLLVTIVLLVVGVILLMLGILTKPIGKMSKLRLFLF